MIRFPLSTTCLFCIGRCVPRVIILIFKSTPYCSLLNFLIIMKTPTGRPVFKLTGSNYHNQFRTNGCRRAFLPTDRRYNLTGLSNYRYFQLLGFFIVRILGCKHFGFGNLTCWDFERISILRLVNYNSLIIIHSFRYPALAIVQFARAE